MPTYRPFFNDYLAHSLSKWALHPSLLRAHNFIGKKKTLPPFPFYFDPRMCFWICWLCIRTSVEMLLQVLAFIIFHRDKTKQQRDGRGQAGVGGGRWLSGTSLTLPERQCVSMWSHILIRLCDLLIKTADLAGNPAITPAPFSVALCLPVQPYLWAFWVKRHRYLCLNSFIRGESAALASPQPPV